MPLILVYHSLLASSLWAITTKNLIEICILYQFFQSSKYLSKYDSSSLVIQTRVTEVWVQTLASRCPESAIHNDIIISDVAKIYINCNNL